MSEDVTRAEAINFCNNALRNMDVGRLSRADIEDIRGALATFASRHRLAAAKAMQDACAQALEREGDGWLNNGLITDHARVLYEAAGIVARAALKEETPV